MSFELIISEISLDAEEARWQEFIENTSNWIKLNDLGGYLCTLSRGLNALTDNDNMVSFIYLQSDGARTFDIKFEKFLVDEITLRRGSAKISLKVVAVVSAFYAGVASYPDFREGAIKLFDDISHAIKRAENTL